MKRLRHVLPGPATCIALAVALPAALSLHESWDLMFSIASGRWILEYGFPVGDPFSLTADSAWFPHSWGFCVLAELMVRALGGAGPAVLMGLVLAAEILLIGRLVGEARAGGLFWLVLVLLVLWAQWYAFGAERAYQFGNLCFAAGLWLALRWRAGADWAAWLFVPLVAAWANLHGSWIVGPALLGSCALGALIDAGRLQRRHLLAAAASAAAFGAAALSPEALHTCLYPFRLVLGIHTRQIAEWHPWSLADGSGRALGILCLIAVWSLARSRDRSWSLLLPTAGLTLACVGNERFAPLAGIALAVTAAYHAAEKGGHAGLPLQLAGAIDRIDGWLKSWRKAASGALWPFAAVVAVGAVAHINPVGLAERLGPRDFPIEALQALCDRPPGRVLNTYRYGGAVSALCGPEYKVFIDGRNDPFPQSVHDDYRKLALLEPGWREALERYDPDYILWTRIGHGGPLLQILHGQGGWREVAGNEMGVLLVPEIVP